VNTEIKHKVAARGPVILNIRLDADLGEVSCRIAEGLREEIGIAGGKCVEIGEDEKSAKAIGELRTEG
jgi:hypothetical protein